MQKDACIHTTAAQVQRFVVFDFDGTVIGAHSPVMLVRSLAFRQHVIPIRTLLAIAWWACRYKMHLPHEQAEVREMIFNLFKEIPACEVDKMMEDLYADKISRHLRADALAEIRSYQEQRIPIILVSASFEPIVKRAVAELGLFAQLSTQMAMVDGRYTGEVACPPMEGVEKRDRFIQYADEFCGGRNWELVAAYGDHHSDIPLLELATRPVAVTPDHGLHRCARERGWEVVNWH